MDLRALAASAHKTEAPKFRGQWHAIEFQPDLCVPQWFVIGAAISRNGNLLAFKIAEHAPRLALFYGDFFDPGIWPVLHANLIQELDGVKQTPIAKFASGSPQIRVGQGFYVSGVGLDAVMCTTFERIVTVTAAKPR